MFSPLAGKQSSFIFFSIKFILPAAAKPQIKIKWWDECGVSASHSSIYFWLRVKRCQPPSVIVTNPNQADASLCLCVQFLIGGLYCYNNIHSYHFFHNKWIVVKAMNEWSKFISEWVIWFHLNSLLWVITFVMSSSNHSFKLSGLSKRIN